MRLNMYMIDASDGDGERYDSCYWASSPEEAVALWLVDWDLLGTAYDLRDLSESDPAKERQDALDDYLNSWGDGVIVSRFEIAPPAEPGPARWRESVKVVPKVPALN